MVFKTKVFTSKGLRSSKEHWLSNLIYNPLADKLIKSRTIPFRLTSLNNINYTPYKGA